MRRTLGNIISILFTFVKFCFLKLFHWNTLYFHCIERLSPNVVVILEKKGKLRLGNKVRMHSGSRLSVTGGELTIGDNCRFNNGCRITCRDKIEIENGVEFGPNVLVYDHDHDFRAEGGLKAGEYKKSPVHIGENSWVGANTVILRGTQIGKNCVIGAGCVVTGDIPDNTVLVQKRENTYISIAQR